MRARALLVGLALSLGALAPACNCGSDAPSSDAGASDGGADPSDEGADAGSDGGADAGLDAGPDGGADAGAPLDPFAIWREVREGYRASPDHLPAEAERVVASGDPAEIHAFVRDRIATYPDADDGFSPNGYNTVRWGVRGALRGGAGTPREKAEVLAHLLREAGFEASVVRGTPDPAALDWREVLFREAPRVVDPGFDAETLDGWRAALGTADDDAGVVIYDEDGLESASLAAGLSALLDGGGAPAFDLDTLPQIPIVRALVDGEVRYANPLVPDAVFGESYLLDAPVPVSAPYQRTVTVRLEAATTEAPLDRFLLVEGTWTFEELAGRRVVAQLAPAGELKTRVHQKLEDLTVFQPLLVLSGPDLSIDDIDASAIVGDAVTVRGDVARVEGEEVVLDGHPLGTGTLDPDVVARVASLDVEVVAGRFPDVILRARTTDADGLTVPGLPAGAFVVEEGGAVEAFSLRQNREPPPRVLLVFDTSSSVPEAFRGQGAVDLGLAIASDLFVERPDAEVRVASVSFGIAPQGPWTGDLADVQTQLEALAGSGSDLWSALAEAADEEPSAVMLLTDGDATDAPTDALRERIANGPPVVALGVGDMPNLALLGEYAALTGGAAQGVADVDEAVAAVLGFLDARLDRDYTLDYVAPLEGAETREVTVRLVGSEVSAQASYRVPRAEERGRARRLSGLYLTVRSGGEEVRRVLAGYAGQSTFPVITEEMIDDVRGALFGSVTLSFEGAPPPYSVLVDDLLTEKLTLEPLWRALEAGDSEAAYDALSQGVRITPPVLALAGASTLPGRQGADWLLFETGLRVTAYSERPVFGVGVRRQIDILPLSRWRAASEGDGGFSRALEATASLAVLEAQRFETSTRSLLAGETLRAVPGEALLAEIGATDEAARVAWANASQAYRRSEWTLLIPDDAEPVAFWAVHEASGTMIGVLDDGGGAGRVDELNAALDGFHRYADALSLLGAFAGFGPAFGAWVSLEKTKAEKLVAAIIVLEGGPPPDTELHRDLACEAADAAIDEALGAVPGVSEIWEGIGLIETGSGAMGVDVSLAPSVCGD